MAKVLTADSKKNTTRKKHDKVLVVEQRKKA